MGVLGACGTVLEARLNRWLRCCWDSWKPSARICSHRQRLLSSKPQMAAACPRPDSLCDRIIWLFETIGRTNYHQNSNNGMRSCFRIQEISS